MHQLILQLFEIGAIRFGSFTLKSGIISPIYIDLRTTVSYPKLLIEISEALYASVQGCSFDLLCGVPYTALPFATAISVRHFVPMVLRRKEKKEYGTGKTLEGVFHAGHHCLIIEDVITSGSSILETARDLQKEGLIVQDAAVLIDRGQGAKAALLQEKIRVHAVFTLSQIVSVLVKEKKINTETQHQVELFLAENQK